MGGAFGRRGEYDFSVLAARVATAMPGVPVQVTWSRDEDTRHDFYRPAGIARFRGKVEAGAPVALEARLAVPSAIRQGFARLSGLTMPGPDKGSVEGLADQPYAFPNYRADGHLADLDVPIADPPPLKHVIGIVPPGKQLPQPLNQRPFQALDLRGAAGDDLQRRWMALDLRVEVFDERCETRLDNGS